jgi:predicted Zn finger-like uncharacterized protein
MKTISCPQCQSSLGITEEMGDKAVRCPKCSHTFSVPDGSASPLPHGEALSAELPPRAPNQKEAVHQEDMRRARYPRDNWEEDTAPDIGLRHTLDPRWKYVKTGLDLMFFSIVSMVGGLFFFLCMTMCTGVVFPREILAREAERLFSVLTLLILLGGTISYLIGLAKCVAVPHPRAKGLVTGSVACLILSIALSFFLNVQGGGLRGPGGAVLVFLLQVLNQVLALAGMVFLILFFKTVAEVFANAALARSCAWFLSLQIPLVLLTIALVFGIVWIFPLQGGLIGLFFARGNPGGLFSFFLRGSAVLIPLGFLTLFFWFMNILNRTRCAIDHPKTGERGHEPPVSRKNRFTR